jgi:hypothetical protein
MSWLDIWERRGREAIAAAAPIPIKPRKPAEPQPKPDLKSVWFQTGASSDGSGEKGAHVLDERLGYARRQLGRLTRHGLKIGVIVAKQTTPARGRRGRQPLEAFAPGWWDFGASDREL